MSLEKLSFGVPVIVLYLQGRVPAILLGFGLFDLFLGLWFVLSYRATAEAAAQRRSTPMRERCETVVRERLRAEQ